MKDYATCSWAPLPVTLLWATHHAKSPSLFPVEQLPAVQRRQSSLSKWYVSQLLKWWGALLARFRIHTGLQWIVQFPAQTVHGDMRHFALGIIQIGHLHLAPKLESLSSFNGQPNRLNLHERDYSIFEVLSLVRVSWSLTSDLGVDLRITCFWTRSTLPSCFDPLDLSYKSWHSTALLLIISHCPSEILCTLLVNPSPNDSSFHFISFSSFSCSFIPVNRTIRISTSPRIPKETVQRCDIQMIVTKIARHFGQHPPK